MTATDKIAVVVCGALMFGGAWFGGWLGWGLFFLCGYVIAYVAYAASRDYT